MRTKERAGFTLTEILVAVLIIGLFAAVAYPNLVNWLPRYRLDRVAAQMESNLRQARLRSMSEGVTVRVEFSDSARTYRIGVYDTVESEFFEDGGTTRTVAANESARFEVSPVSGGLFIPDGSFSADSAEPSLWVLLRSTCGRFDNSIVIWPSGVVRRYDRVWEGE